MRGSSPRMTAESPMRKKGIRYTKGSIGRVRVIENFLPPPEALVCARTR